MDVKYYVRINFAGFKDVIDAMGGVDIVLPEPTAGYEAGKHHLKGNKALAFTRQRMGSDDFFRMEHGQLILKAAFAQMLHPSKWLRWPLVINALSKSVDTNVPVWLWPRLGFTLLRSGANGIDNQTISREMATPYTTDQGASVLIPNWQLINPLLLKIFGQ